MKSPIEVALLAALASALLLLGPAARAETVFEQRSDVYDIEWSGISLGQGEIALTRAGNCYRYESKTHPMALVRWTYGSPREVSEFCVDADGQIRPKHFEYVNDKRAKDNFTLDFDLAARQVKAIKGGNVTIRELPEQAYDRFLLQQAVRQWVMRHAQEESPAPVEFTMVDDDRMKVYRFAITAREKVRTNAGTFDTIRVERVDNPDKSLRLWLAPARAYAPVKIEHVEKGEVKLRMSVRD
ncbi:MAG TPA: DUF3108 domain-containing protein [Solimonas sp.]|nr:DUF3108 domain-containing protein [Solimonas sp.]